MSTDRAIALAAAIREDVQLGSQDYSKSLGFAQMPTGYALMLNADRSHFYWLRHDGSESEIDWNKWRVRKRAIADAVAQLPPGTNP